MPLAGTIVDPRMPSRSAMARAVSETSSVTIAMRIEVAIFFSVMVGLEYRTLAFTGRTLRSIVLKKRCSWASTSPQALSRRFMSPECLTANSCGESNVHVFDQLSIECVAQKCASATSTLRVPSDRVSRYSHTSLMSPDGPERYCRSPVAASEWAVNMLSCTMVHFVRAPVKVGQLVPESAFGFG